MKINITKRFLLSLCLMTLTLLCGGNKAWGQAATTLFLENFGTTGNRTAVASYTGWSATSSMFTDGTASTNYSSDDSKINSTDASSYDGASGSCNVYNQGKANTPKTILKITHINIEGYSDITLNFGCFFASTKHTVDVSYIIDNGTEKNLTLDTYKVTKGNQWLYLSGKIPSTGKSLTLIFRHTPTKDWLMRLDDIKVTGVASTPTPAPTFSLKEGTYFSPQHVTITAPDGYTGGIVYTIDGTDPTESSSAEYYSDAGIDINTTTTLRAVAYDSEFNFSSEATATYTIRSTDQKTNSVTFDFSKPADYGYSAPTSGSYTVIGERNTILSDEVTITNTKDGDTSTRFHNKSGIITLRAYANAELTISVPAGYFINSIEITGSEGEYSLGDKTTTNGSISWNGSAQAVTLNNVTAKSFLETMTVNYRLLYFSDTEDLKASLPETELADQTITLNRNLYSGWNTFCVPFALTQKQLEEAYGSGAVAKYLSGVTTDGAAATLHFTPENGGGIEANKAYLLYLTADVTKPKTFSGVTLKPAADCTTKVKADNGGEYTFQGILKPTTLTTDDTQYFLNSLGTNFVLPSNSTSAMKATRAYITVPVSGSAQGRQYNFDFNGTTTAIDNVTVSGMEDGAWYTISGIRVNRPAAKGVYIHNGRKVIVK